MYEAGEGNSAVIGGYRKIEGKRLLMPNVWCGVGLDLPASWNVVAAHGNRDQGYLRADSENASSAEVRWQKSKKKPDLEKTIGQYLKQVKKYSRKKKVDYLGQVAALDSTSNDIRFEWSADRQGEGRVFWCSRCQRTCIAQISYEKGNVVQGIDQILDTLRDHTPDENSLEWSVYGLYLKVPAQYRLLRQRLMSGFMSFNFVNRKKRILVERWGLAESITEGRGFIGWHNKEYLKDFKTLLADTRTVEWGDHEALITEGYETGFRRLMSFVKAFGIPSRMERFASIVWMCPQTNRIVGVRAHSSDASDIATSVASTIVCHGEK